MKKLNKKGFTLVELLAVIVILALLMVVLVPKAIEAINNSRANTFVEGYQAFINTVELKYAEGTSNDATCDESGSTKCSKTYGLATDYNAKITNEGYVIFKGTKGRFTQANISEFGTYYTETTTTTTPPTTTRVCDATKIQKGAVSCGYYICGTTGGCNYYLIDGQTITETKPSTEQDPIFSLANGEKGPVIIGKLSFGSSASEN